LHTSTVIQSFVYILTRAFYLRYVYVDHQAYLELAKVKHEQLNAFYLCYVRVDHQAYLEMTREKREQLNGSPLVEAAVWEWWAFLGFEQSGEVTLADFLQLYTIWAKVSYV
jgi:hypothetical protein